MSILVKRPFQRRDLLRGILGGGAISVALPFLDCFLNDKGTALASGAPLPVRFGTWFWGLGHTPGHGIAPNAPEIEFRDQTKPLEPHKRYINYFSDFNTPLDGKVSAVHFTGWVGCRTGTVPPRGGEIPAPTLDVLVSDVIGTNLRFKSLDISSTGNPGDSYSYRGTGSRNAAEVSPLALYARLFGPEFAKADSANSKPDPSLMVRKSVLSSVGEQSKAFLRRLGSADKARVDEYFTSIRQLERQLELQMQPLPKNEACRVPRAPEDTATGLEIPIVVANHRTLTTILSMALSCNQTRVFNMLYSPSLSTLRRPGEAFTHHTLTHEEPIDETLGYQREVAVFHKISMEALATFIEAFASVREGDGTLLDNMLVFANSDTNDAKVHAVDGVPVLTIGRAGGQLKTGIHVRGSGDPITRVGLTCMQVMGLPLEKWGTGSLQTSKAISQILA